jgi:hypothetical protein
MITKIKSNAGFLSNLTFSLTSIFGTFLLTPIIIKAYGKDIFILWSIVNSICALLFIVDFGITSVASRQFLKAHQHSKFFAWHTWGKYLHFHNRLILISSLILTAGFLTQMNHQNFKMGNLQNLLIFIFTLIGTIATVLSHQQIIKFQIFDGYSTSLTILTIIKILETALILFLMNLAMNFSLITFIIASLHLFQLFVLKHISNGRLPQKKSEKVDTIEIRFKISNYISTILYSASSVLGIHGTFILQSLILNSNQVLIIVLSRMIVSPIRIFSDALAIGNFDKLIRNSLGFKSINLRANMPVANLYRILVLFSTSYLLALFFVADFIINFISYGTSNLNVMLLCLFGLANIMDGSIVIFMQNSISNGSQGNKGIIYFVITLTSMFLLIFLVDLVGVYGGAISIVICDLGFFLLMAFTQKFRLRL